MTLSCWFRVEHFLNERIKSSINNTVALLWHLTLDNARNHQSNRARWEVPLLIKIEKITPNRREKQNVCAVWDHCLNINREFWPNFAAVNMFSPLFFFSRVSHFIMNICAFCFDERIKIRILMTIYDVCDLQHQVIMLIRWSERAAYSSMLKSLLLVCI